MQNNDQKREKKSGGGLRAGLVLGAVGAAAGAAAIAMSDKGNQRKVKRLLDRVQTKSNEFRDMAKKRLDQAENMVSDTKKTTKKKVAAVKRAVK